MKSMDGRVQVEQKARRAKQKGNRLEEKVDAGARGAGGDDGRGGRERQRRRTRKAIIAAAASFIARGASPSMADIAEAADVSRRTVYLYFPTLEHLLADAALEASRSTVEPRFEGGESAADRLEGLVRATHQGFAATEELGRTIIRHTVGAARKREPGAPPRRGYRRVEWIERALEPLRPTLPPQRFERLVSALALLIGWEAMIVLQDVRGLEFAEAEEVCVWAARTLLAAETAEPPPDAGSGSSRRRKRN
jgi:AcrR family transcriptional regulator